MLLLWNNTKKNNNKKLKYIRGGSIKIKNAMTILISDLCIFLLLGLSVYLNANYLKKKTTTTTTAFLE